MPLSFQPLLPRASHSVSHGPPLFLRDLTPLVTAQRTPLCKTHSGAKKFPQLSDVSERPFPRKRESRIPPFPMSLPTLPHLPIIPKARGHSRASGNPAPPLPMSLPARPHLPMSLRGPPKEGLAISPFPFVPTSTRRLRSLLRAQERSHPSLNKDSQ